MFERSEFSSCRLSSFRLRDPEGQGIGCVSLLTFFAHTKKVRRRQGSQPMVFLLSGTPDGFVLDFDFEIYLPSRFALQK